MDLSPMPVASAIGSFLLAFPALFSVVNPLGNALIFNEVTTGQTRDERRRLATRIAVYSLVVLCASLLLGGYILTFFGVSLSALRIAGGLVVAVRAWSLLIQPEVHETRKANAAGGAQDSAEDVAFFPMTMPITTGPGTIAVAIALSSQRPATGVGTLEFFGGLTVAAICIAITVWICYASAARIEALLGPGGARITSRLVAFLLLCIGVQIMITGVIGVAALLTPSLSATP